MHSDEEHLHKIHCDQVNIISPFTQITTPIHDQIQRACGETSAEEGGKTYSHQLLSNGLQVMFDAEEVSRLPAVLSGELLVSHVSSIWLTITLPGGALLWSDFSSHLGFLPGF